MKKILLSTVLALLVTAVGWYTHLHVVSRFSEIYPITRGTLAWYLLVPATLRSLPPSGQVGAVRYFSTTEIDYGVWATFETGSEMDVVERTLRAHLQSHGYSLVEEWRHGCRHSRYYGPTQPRGRQPAPEEPDLYMTICQDKVQVFESW